MRAKKVVGLAALATAALMLVGTGAAAQQLPLEPPHKDFGQAVWPVYEGWYDNPDGSYTFLIGYFNPNREQTFDLPVGESNFFSPGEPDRGQPTHFTTVRGWAVFGVRVGKDYADKAKQLTWTLVTNDQTTSIPMHTDPGWYVEPFEDAANKNRPPALQFEPGGKAFEGPPVDGVASSYTAMVSKPLTVKMWTDDFKGAGYDVASPQTTTSDRPQTNRRRRPGLVLRWMKVRGPGDVTFGEDRQTFQESKQTPENELTFSEPGEYIVRVEALDETGSGGGGSQCCWTSAYIRVNVSTPSNTTGE
ncbi:MAG: hypothetical protein QGI10_16040 [Vicinamibacterales bacterium]|jgi:hypothetical protein|nr:hypothetical protein [Vicinamibacterales bacterium]MDP7480771.1 hypothetical protein [Vicinamibacterales bacterium]MDP7692697.1 hypothetical protein [Vicinamibacterales bacterium]HJN43211.1 hypothetical protein [Vicinamibacterales bacterium]|tara:strand:- start:2233 stop:3144 length:912 start_codon:yes stop_codon:yes gene_type:complete